MVCVRACVRAWCGGGACVCACVRVRVCWEGGINFIVVVRWVVFGDIASSVVGPEAVVGMAADHQHAGRLASVFA